MKIFEHDLRACYKYARKCLKNWKKLKTFFKYIQSLRMKGQKNQNSSE